MGGGQFKNAQPHVSLAGGRLEKTQPRVVSSLLSGCVDLQYQATPFAALWPFYDAQRRPWLCAGRIGNTQPHLSLCHGRIQDPSYTARWGGGWFYGTQRHAQLSRSPSTATPSHKKCRLSWNCCPGMYTGGDVEIRRTRQSS
jgi:hypothetical protein